MQHTWGEEDEDPGVDDGGDRDESEGIQVRVVRDFSNFYGVDVHPDLREDRSEKS